MTKHQPTDTELRQSLEYFKGKLLYKEQKRAWFGASPALNTPGKLIMFEYPIRHSFISGKAIMLILGESGGGSSNRVLNFEEVLDYMKYNYKKERR